MQKHSKIFTLSSSAHSRDCLEYRHNFRWQISGCEVGKAVSEDMRFLPGTHACAHTNTHTHTATGEHEHTHTHRHTRTHSNVRTHTLTLSAHSHSWNFIGLEKSSISYPCALLDAVAEYKHWCSKLRLPARYACPNFHRYAIRSEDMEKSRCINRYRNPLTYVGSSTSPMFVDK